MNEIYWETRKDFIGLSTETKETTGIADGSTYYEVDTVKLYVFYKGTWYLQEKTEESEG